MSWGMHEAAKKLASGWYSELDTTREINADLGRENAKLRERVAELEELTDEKRYIPQEWYQLATVENAKLRDENARLRSCLSDDADNARQIIGENAQLRELVAELASFISRADWLQWPELADRMAELGIWAEQ